MPQRISFKRKWEEVDEGFVCKVTAIHGRTRRILSVVRISVPVYTESDFRRLYGVSIKRETEKAAIEIARTIAEGTPDLS